MTVSDFENYIKPGMRGHLIGIGGVSMSPLAEVLSGLGIVVTGSDMSESAAVARLRGLGIQIHQGHHAENISGADFIVRTAAVHDENPEIAAAHAAGIPVFERAQAWGYIMRGYKNAVCISGTHGKTTTTSMMTHILMAAEKDPTVMIGGTLPILRSGHRVGNGDTIVLESCEYYNSFHSFSPTVAVILNIDADHLDFFKDLEDIKASFATFAALAPADGHIVANADDKNTMDALAGLGRELLTFGLSASAKVRGENLHFGPRGSEFDIVYDGKVYVHALLHMPGKHNVLNALAAAASAIALGIPGEAIAEGLSAFTGAGRRLEFKGRFNGADIYDDYAHHPGELHALIDAVLSMEYERVICVFQPHTFTRTKALFSDFVQELSRVDLPYLAEIYAAREKNTVGISSSDLAREIPNAMYFPTFTEIEEQLRRIARPGDIILTVGAGDIFKIGEDLLR